MTPVRRPRSPSPAEKFWIGLAVYIVAADVYLWRHDCDTMSVCFGEWLKTRNGRAACLAATAGLVIHLYYGVPLPGQTKLKHLTRRRENGNGRIGNIRKSLRAQWYKSLEEPHGAGGLHR